MPWLSWACAVRGLAIAALLGGSVDPIRAEIRERDDAGIEAVLAAPARRIVSLSPHATELLFAAGAGARVVGVVEYSDFPPEASRIEQIGSSRAVDLERIVGLRPDLIVAWKSGNGERQVQALRGLRVAVYETEQRTLDDVPTAIEALGRLAGTAGVARAAAGAFRERLSALRRQYAARPPVSVFHQVWSSPLLTVNRNHVINDVITVCAGRNVFAELPALTPTVGVEAVLRSNPEVITTASVTEAEARAFEEWKRWPSLTATARGNFVVVHPDNLSRNTPRILDGVAQICAGLEAARGRRPR